MNYSAPDLTENPPRSARVRLGGYVMLPRLLDKCRAELAGKNGEYHYACPLDQRYFEFVGINQDDLKAEAASGRSDAELLAWISTNSTTKPTILEIRDWSNYQSARVPSDPDSRDFFNGLHKEAAAHREDIETWFDLLDLDDFVTFGGKA